VGSSRSLAIDAPRAAGTVGRVRFADARPFGLFDLYVCTRPNVYDDFGWSAPEKMGSVVNSVYGDAGPTVLAGDGGATTLWFTVLSKPGGLGDCDIHSCVLRGDGTIGEPQNVVELNSPFRETRTTIRHDGREMIISSERPGGVANGPGASDLRVATRAHPGD
jgi:hypothetical protein